MIFIDPADIVQIFAISFNHRMRRFLTTAEIKGFPVLNNITFLFAPIICYVTQPIFWDTIRCFILTKMMTLVVNLHFNKVSDIFVFRINQYIDTRVF